MIKIKSSTFDICAEDSAIQIKLRIDYDEAGSSIERVFFHTHTSGNTFSFIAKDSLKVERELELIKEGMQHLRTYPKKNS